MTADAGGVASGVTTGSSPSLRDLAVAGQVPPLTLVFVRHGVTDMTESHALSGSSVPGPPLNTTGRIQAARAADAAYRIGRSTWEYAAKVTDLIASPMERTQNTAEALGRRLGLKAEIEPLVREVHFGSWEGLTVEEVAREDGQRLIDWQHGRDTAPSGESLPDVGERMWEFIEAQAAHHAQQCADQPRARTVAVATHAVAIKTAMGTAMRMDTEQWGLLWPGPASLTVMQFGVGVDGAVGERHLLGFAVPTG